MWVYFFIINWYRVHNFADTKLTSTLFDFMSLGHIFHQLAQVSILFTAVCNPDTYVFIVIFVNQLHLFILLLHFDYRIYVIKKHSLYSHSVREYPESSAYILWICSTLCSIHYNDISLIFCWIFTHYINYNRKKI